ncbi:MAG: hypothetical protein H0X30_29950, partial [Anaerolineae bacterium]|nr:hypothetical protein [Anaerolineae bacterium]
ETIRKWAVEFENELSPTANPGDGRQRVFVDDDLAIFALISEMKGQGKLYTDIHAALANGQRGSAPQNAKSLIVADPPRALALQTRIDALESQLTTALNANQRLEGRFDEVNRQLEAAKAEIKALNREIGRLESGKGSE